MSSPPELQGLVMRIHFQTLDYFRHATTRLQQLVGGSLSVCQQRTAYVLGYRDFHELRESLATNTPSTLDDHVGDVAVFERRDFQARRYAEAADSSPMLARALVGMWRPSSARSARYDQMVKGRTVSFDSMYDHQAHHAKNEVLVDMLRLTLGWELLAVNLLADSDKPICFATSSGAEAAIPVFAPVTSFHPRASVASTSVWMDRNPFGAIDRSDFPIALLLVRHTCEEDPNEPRFYMGSLLYGRVWKHLSWHLGLASFDALLAESLALPSWSPSTEDALPLDGERAFQRAYRLALDNHGADPYSHDFSEFSGGMD